MDGPSSSPATTLFYNTASPGSTPAPVSPTATTHEQLIRQLWTDVRVKLNTSQAEIIERNTMVIDNDAYVYGNKIETMLDIPIGHDFTPVNWLRRVVEVHRTQFMGRPFQVVSTYHVKDINMTSEMTGEVGAFRQGAPVPADKQRLVIENQQQKATSQLRQQTVKTIIRDNGGHAMFINGAESASVTGSWIVKGWYDEDDKKYNLSPVEAVENCYAVWEKDDFRKVKLFGYAYQVDKQVAMDDWGVSKDVATSPVGSPLDIIAAANPRPNIESQPMVTVLEATGIVDGWRSKNGLVEKCDLGDETPMNLLFVGNTLQKIIDVEKKLPKYYILPNKQVRRRAWGFPDITHGAIMLNLAYIETLSDWRTVANKVNFPKFKLLNFGAATQLPKFKSRQIQAIPLAEGQDIANLPMGDAGQIDFRSQLQEIKTEFSRETATAPVLLDNDGQNVPANSNQALITSMKPTTDVAETKKELWSPILAQMFTDAIHILAAYEPETYKDLADDSDPWYFRVQWPSMIQKEDPIYQQMLLNRWNAGTLSLQSFLEAENESYEEIDRIRDEMSDITTAAIHSRALSTLFQLNFLPAPSVMPPKVNVNLRGDLDPGQVGNLSYLRGFNGGQGEPYPTSAGPVGYAGEKANAAVDNQGMIAGQTSKPPTGIMRGPNGQVVNTQANNQPGQGVMSQPGSGATPVSPQGAANQVNQNIGG